MKKQYPKIPDYATDDTQFMSGRFLMLTPELLESKEFQKLSYAARSLYITLCVHKETEIQRLCLKKALEEYNEILNLGWSDTQILEESYPNKRTKYTHNYFVCPAKHLEDYGYKKNYATKLKQELINHGFIKAPFCNKGRYAGWNKNVTVYQFCNDWKKHGSL